MDPPGGGPGARKPAAVHRPARRPARRHQDRRLRRRGGPPAPRLGPAARRPAVPPPGRLQPPTPPEDVHGGHPRERASARHLLPGTRRPALVARRQARRTPASGPEPRLPALQPRAAHRLDQRRRRMEPRLDRPLALDVLAALRRPPRPAGRHAGPSDVGVGASPRHAVPDRRLAARRLARAAGADRHPKSARNADPRVLVVEHHRGADTRHARAGPGGRRPRLQLRPQRPNPNSATVR